MTYGSYPPRCDSQPYGPPGLWGRRTRGLFYRVFCCSFSAQVHVHASFCSHPPSRGVSSLLAGAGKWQGGTGSKWLSEANTLRALSSDPSPGDLEQLRACVCRRGWCYRCRSVCYPGYGEEVAGIRGCFQTRGLCPVASSKTQGTAVSSFLLCRGQGKRSAPSCQVLT